MSRQLISSEKFPPKPHNCQYTFLHPGPDHGLTYGDRCLVGPATKVPGLVFCAGQTATGEIKQATRTVLQNLKAVLELSGSSLEQVVKYNVYLADMKDFAAMNEVYIDFLPKPMPSRSCLQAVPPGEGTVIEIECIAQV
ncbi:RidA family protein [Aspergillus lucknowensis]|uniref:Endoribonuclease L-PSP/chorismate mutase-like protein n=1 Tax=Aspergillus lucknowensis TaxID=176173 RepID=A0ABR4M4B8_9EURO